MTVLTIPNGATPTLEYVQGRGCERYSTATPQASPSHMRDHPLLRAPLVGVITDRMMFRASPSSPEVPFATGRVWLLRLADGYKAWEGWSDAGGYYTATGLELGIEYIAVGIDPYRNNKATGAGPVVAA